MKAIIIHPFCLLFYMVPTDPNNFFGPDLSADGVAVDLHRLESINSSKLRLSALLNAIAERETISSFDCHVKLDESFTNLKIELVRLQPDDFPSFIFSAGNFNHLEVRNIKDGLESILDYCLPMGINDKHSSPIQTLFIKPKKFLERYQVSTDVSYTEEIEGTIKFADYPSRIILKNKEEGGKIALHPARVYNSDGGLDYSGYLYRESFPASYIANNSKSSRYFNEAMLRIGETIDKINEQSPDNP